ncbi:PDZ domain-containing protein [Planomicrobium sp. YIM 101495]|uniref:PDZ domain-containing protein n=1 Tax=Planomicrobium sp. YIM 101495 TaxID=2665160 RepID=UPI00351A8172
MVSDLFFDIVRFFLNPVFYIAIAAAIVLGYVRVKRERKMFRSRIVWGWTELVDLLRNTLLISLLLSVVMAGIGLTVPMEWLIALTAISFVMVLSGWYQMGSFVYLSAAAVALGWLFRRFGWDINVGPIAYEGLYINWEWLLPVALLTAGLLVAEGILIKKQGAPRSSPRLEKSARGLTAASFETKRLWLLPILLVVPGDLIASSTPYWPQLTIGETAFSFILFPFIIGFGNRTRKTLPLYFYPALGKSILSLGIAVLILALISFAWEPMALIAIGIAALGRFGLMIRSILRERGGLHAAAPQAQGVMILDVLPKSPAEKMGLLRGEVIRKINGLTVSNETELYEAIQVNAAHCRLEVLDHQGEVRLRQHVIFRHDHHRLGLIVLG